MTIPRRARTGTGQVYYGWKLRRVLEDQPERIDQDTRLMWWIICVAVPLAIVAAALIVTL